MRSSTLSFPVLLSVVLSLACDSPAKEATPPAKAPAEVGTRTAGPETKVVAPPAPAAPTEVKDAVGEPAGGAEATPPPPPTEAAPAKTEPTPAGAGDAATASDGAAKAKGKEPSPPEAATARKADEGRPVKAFTDCRSSEAFADGRCYASREAACEALSCAGKCIHTRSMPPQVVCG